MQKKAQLFTSKEDFINQYREECESLLSKKYDELQPQERYYVLASLIASKAKNFKVDAKKGDKSVYYFSLEFLIGPLLDNYLLNFGILNFTFMMSFYYISFYFVTGSTV